MLMSNKTYDTLKTIALMFIPISVFVASMINIFDVPNADIITAVLSAIDTLIGSLVTIAKQVYENAKQMERESEDDYAELE